VNRPSVVVLGLGLVTAAVSAGRVWVRFTVQDPVLGLQSQGASGYAAAPALSACGLMALAALLVLLLTRRWARATGLVVLSASAVAAAWLVGGVLRDPLGAARASLAEPGVTGAAVRVVRGGATVWPWTFAMAVLLVLVGASWLGWSWWVQARTRREVGPAAVSRRQPPAAATPSDADRERRSNHDAWRELSEGKDPTD